jgi:hypothetical protein
MAVGAARPHQPGTVERNRHQPAALFAALVSATGLAARAVVIAGEIDHPVYDCLYFALAEAEQAGLVTADMHLVAKVSGSAWERWPVNLSEYDPASTQ